MHIHLYTCEHAQHIQSHAEYLKKVFLNRSLTLCPKEVEKEEQSQSQRE